jgi:peptidoglycan lytic transglycosylase
VQFWLLVVASCVALTGAVLTLSTGIVHADALLSRSVVSMPAASPIASPTPVQDKPEQTKGKNQVDMLYGVASWYGAVFNGRRTASGERFNMYAMTACHPTLPFGTRVRVVNTANNKSVVVRITDRGNLFNERIIDLSYGAAKKLQMTKSGLAEVKLEVISMGHSHEKK